MPASIAGVGSRPKAVMSPGRAPSWIDPGGNASRTASTMRRSAARSRGPGPTRPHAHVTSSEKSSSGVTVTRSVVTCCCCCGRSPVVRTATACCSRGRYSAVNRPTSAAGTCTGAKARTAARCATSITGTGATCSERVARPRASRPVDHQAIAASSARVTASSGRCPPSPVSTRHETSRPSGTAWTSSRASRGSSTTAAPAGRLFVTNGRPASRSSQSRSQTRRLSMSVRSSHEDDRSYQ